MFLRCLNEIVLAWFQKKNFNLLYILFSFFHEIINLKLYNIVK